MTCPTSFEFRGDFIDALEIVEALQHSDAASLSDLFLFFTCSSGIGSI